MISNTNKGIGGNEIPLDANEAISNISANRTLLTQQLTEQEPIKPELIEGLNTIEKVFEHFKPSIKVDFEDENGSIKIEEMQFKSLGDFGIKGITEQSTFLSDLENEKQEYQKIIKQLKGNKVLKSVLQDTQVKQDLLSAIEFLIQELKQN